MNREDEVSRFHEMLSYLSPSTPVPIILIAQDMGVSRGRVDQLIENAELRGISLIRERGTIRVDRDSWVYAWEAAMKYWAMFDGERIDCEARHVRVPDGG